MRVVFLGPPGAGKGTQAKRIADRFEVPFVSTGELLRDHIRAGTDIGTLAKAFMERGELVPGDIVDGMVADWLLRPEAAAGFALDGYPRTLEQVDAMDRILRDAG